MSDGLFLCLFQEIGSKLLTLKSSLCSEFVVILGVQTKYLEDATFEACDVASS